MPQPDQPSADAALLVGLSAAVSGMIAFAILMYWLMQPTVLPNAPYDMAAHGRRAPIILRASAATPLPDLEQSAVAMAARENERQGLRQLAVAIAERETPPAQVVSTAKPAKPKRAVARAPRREAEGAFAWNWWGGERATFGSSWYR
jgi:hypothetical protein